VLRDTLSADGQQSTSSGAGVRSSTRDTASDRLDYQIFRSIDVYGQLGWEDIHYSGTNALDINDLTWGFGTVLTPNADSQLTLGYGHQNGANSLIANARYALTTRTILTASYNNGVGTQLEQVNEQLSQASVNNNGGLVNSQTGNPLFVGNNALGVAPGVYRYSYLSFGATVTLDRDTITATLGHSQETQLGAGIASRTNAVSTGSFLWTHELTADLVATANAALSFGAPVAGLSSRSFVAGVALQYTLTDTLSTFARYSFYDVHSTSVDQMFYQDIFLVGITKQF
jgi:hypothetical protein